MYKVNLEEICNLLLADKAGIVFTSGLPDEAKIVEKIQDLEEYGKQRSRKPAFEADLQYPKPVFTTHIKDVANLVERQTAHFEARLEPASDPDLKVEWYFNGKPLEAGMFFLNGVFLFIFRKITVNV